MKKLVVAVFFLCLGLFGIVQAQVSSDWNISGDWNMNMTLPTPSPTPDSNYITLDDAAAFVVLAVVVVACVLAALFYGAKKTG